MIITIIILLCILIVTLFHELIYISLLTLLTFILLVVSFAYSKAEYLYKKIRYSNFFAGKRCPYCKKKDKVQVSYRDWCDRCKKII